MQPRKPTSGQARIISGAGLDPEKWSVVKENKLYLYLVDRGIEQREDLIIDKSTGEVVTRKMP